VPRRSAGLLLYRGKPREVLLVHMGGPFWARKEARAWSLPKGEYQPGEDPLAEACREFAEELGIPPPATDYQPLGEVRQAGGKVVTAFGAEADVDLSQVAFQAAEVDRAEWTPLELARQRLVAAQVEFLDRLPS
jgi:predicted NUDIX family NTP pyrophosphohydrolase